MIAAACFALLVLVVDGAAPASVSSHDVGATTLTRRASSKFVVPAAANEEILGTDEIVRILVTRHIPALKQSLSDLSDVVIPPHLEHGSVMMSMLEPIRKLVDYMDSIHQSVVDHVKGTPLTEDTRRHHITTNEALYRIREAATIFESTMEQSTADASAMEAMQTILEGMLNLSEYLLTVDVYEQAVTNLTTVMEEAREQEKKAAPTTKWNATRRVADDFMNAFADPRPHTQFECCVDDCHFNDCCLDCCLCCPECGYPPAGDQPPVIPPAA